MVRFQIVEVPVKKMGEMMEFRLLDKRKIVASLIAKVMRGRGWLVISHFDSLSESSNLAFFRFLKKSAGEGRTPMQELFTRALKWGLSKDCKTIFPAFPTPNGIKFLNREIERGTIDGNGTIKKVPKKVDIERLQKERPELISRPKTSWNRLLQRFRRRK